MVGGFTRESCLMAFTHGDHTFTFVLADAFFQSDLELNHVAGLIQYSVRSITQGLLLA